MNRLECPISKTNDENIFALGLFIYMPCMKDERTVVVLEIGHSGMVLFCNFGWKMAGFVGLDHGPENQCGLISRQK